MVVWSLFRSLPVGRGVEIRGSGAVGLKERVNRSVFLGMYVMGQVFFPQILRVLPPESGSTTTSLFFSSCHDTGLSVTVTYTCTCRRGTQELVVRRSSLFYRIPSPRRADGLVGVWRRRQGRGFGGPGVALSCGSDCCDSDHDSVRPAASPRQIADEGCEAAGVVAPRKTFRSE